MNGGIHDAFSLADKLAEVIRGAKPVTDLDAYERQRRPIALEYVNTISAANKRNLEARDPEEQRRWRDEMTRAASDPALAREYVRRISMIASLKKAALLLVLLAVLPLTLFAQSFPSRQITVIVPYAPGSTSDLLPRAIAPLMSQSMGVPVIVENRPGGGGSIGAVLVARGDASGHMLLMAPSGILATSQWLYKDLPYSPRKDLTPVTNAATTPNVWVAHPSLPVKTLGDVIALAKSKPGALSFGSGGNASTSHLCGELLKSAAHVDLFHVPYKGPAPALQDVLAGRVPLMCDNFSNVITHVRSGRLRAIVVTALKRHPEAPEVPTADESGLPGFEINVWYGFAVPAATPKPVVQKLNAEIGKALRNGTVAERLQSLGLTIVADTPEEFASFVAAESEKMRKLVEVSGARAD